MNEKLTEQKVAHPFINESPTEYEAVNSIIREFSTESQGIFGDKLLAMYLHGSLANGAFSQGKGSDIDFITVLGDEASEDALEKLREMISRLVQREPEMSKKLEGSFIPKDWLRSSEPPEKVRPYIHDGKLDLWPYGYEWVLEKLLIREKGIIVIGPNPSQLIEPIPFNEVRQANSKILVGDWEPMLSDESTRLQDDEYQTYAVLTMCRSLYLFANNQVASKPTAVAWATQTLPQWCELIEAAANWRAGQKFDRLDEVKNFITFTIEFTGAKG